jgi:hypothetical protein
MLINVTSILHKHILAAENYLTSPTIGARIWGENNQTKEEWKFVTRSDNVKVAEVFVTNDKSKKTFKSVSEMEIL